jgi:hypothetical protein
MKKRIVLVALLISALLSIVFYAHAHSGRTDGSGGHHDRQNGGYHFHHGYSAHYHPNGECPYEPTIKNESSSAINSETDEDLERAKEFVQAYLKSKRQQQEQEEKLKDSLSDEQDAFTSEENQNNLIDKIEDFVLSADWKEILATFFICFIFVLVITLLVSPYANGSTTIKSQKSKKFILAIHVIIVVGIPLVLTILIYR